MMKYLDFRVYLFFFNIVVKYKVYLFEVVEIYSLFIKIVLMNGYLVDIYLW